jgi:PAS domain S-box-containing protein
MVMISDAAGTIEYVNQRFTAITGYAPAEVIGQNLRIFMTNASPLDTFETIWQTITGGSKWRGEIMNRKKDGELYCEEITISPLADETGDTTHFVSVMEDISKRRRTEEALRESEYLIKQSQNAARIGSYKAYIGNGFWESSEGLDQILGIDKSYRRNLQGWLDLVHPDDAAMMDRYLREEVLPKRKPINKEFRIIRKCDGEIRKVNGLGKVDFDADGNITSMIGTIMDITDSKRAAEELQQFQALCEFAPIGIFKTDWEGNNIYSNPRWEEITGLSAAEASGKGWLKSIHPDDSKRFGEAWLKAIVSGEPYSLEHRVVTPQGGTVSVRAMASNIKDTDGQIVGFVGTLEDITERSQAHC